MIARRIVYAPEARTQLSAIFAYLAAEASPQVARAFTDAIMARCESLAEFPNRGTPRDDLAPGLRTIPFRRRATILYGVEPEIVVIAGIFYAGQEVAAPRT